MVYLVCDKCENYYELKRGEKPGDFDLKCECGGTLHADTIKDRKNQSVQYFTDSFGNASTLKSKANNTTRKINNNWTIVRSHTKENFLKKVTKLEENGYKLHPESLTVGITGGEAGKYHALLSYNREDNRIRSMIFKSTNLFPCPDCGHNISKKAKSCPKCGRELDDLDKD